MIPVMKTLVGLLLLLGLAAGQGPFPAYKGPPPVLVPASHNNSRELQAAREASHGRGLLLDPASWIGIISAIAGLASSTAATVLALPEYQTKGFKIANSASRECMDFGYWDAVWWTSTHFVTTYVGGKATTNSQCHGASWQRFKFDGESIAGQEDPDGRGGPGGPAGHGYIEAQCLDIDTRTPYTFMGRAVYRVLHYQCHGGPNQRWASRKRETNGEGFAIRSRHFTFESFCLFNVYNSPKDLFMVPCDLALRYNNAYWYVPDLGLGTGA